MAKIKFVELSIPGVYLIEPVLLQDDRGFFARMWCKREFEEFHLASNLVQINISNNMKAGTLRGMHFQLPPHEETKIVRCSRGAIYDVVLDLRQESKTYKKWLAVELKSIEYKSLYIPHGVAHGFQTLTDDAEVLYFMTEFYFPGSSGGVLWNDTAFSIQWPLPNPIMSDRDQSFQKFVQ
jgi:dTDP-4-dehydrorhamnose 3,5-epimerase